MKVLEIMSRQVQLIGPDQSLEEAAMLMSDCDVGALPVREDDRLVGMITDRDIAIRAVASGMGPETRVRAVMSRGVKYCFEEQDLSEVAENMGDIQVRRLPVVDRDKRLVGIVAVGDLACTDVHRAGQAMAGISKPGGDPFRSIVD